MRNSLHDHSPPDFTIAAPGDAGWSLRTSADAKSLVLELARAVRGFTFYDEMAPQRRALADRAYRALASELTRAGVVEIELCAVGFRLVGVTQPVEARDLLDDLKSALRNHDLERLRFDSALTPEALAGLLDLLSGPAGRFGDPSRFAQALEARDSSGIHLNGLERTESRTVRKLSATPIRATLTAAHPAYSPPRTAAETGRAAAAPESVEADAAQATAAADPAAGSESCLRTATSSRETTSTLDDEPLATPSTHDRGERLRARLIELDVTVDDDRYGVRAEEVVVWAHELFASDFHDDCYRALLVLADHAVGAGGRPERQARIAAACFAQLASGQRLHDLIDRSIGATSNGVRAAQLLLQLGERAVPPILDRLCEIDADGHDPTRSADARSRLSGLALTLGEVAMPTIFEAIAGQDDLRAGIAIRLAGEMQNTEVLPAVLSALRMPSLVRRVEAIRALSQLPGEASKQALEQALGSDLEEIAVAATHAVATTDGASAVPMLLDVLEMSVRSGRTQLSRSLIETLGGLGDDRAVPRLSSILERKPVLRRAHWHAVQLAAVDALCELPTKEARRSIERAAQYGVRPVRDRARDRLSAAARALASPR